MTLPDQTVHVLFMGPLQSLAGGSERRLPVSDSVCLSNFKALLAGDDRELLAALQDRSVRVAINAVLALRGQDPMIRPGDEVAFMPPFSGG
jgi:molybdopterin converting factor small subunit